MHRYPFSYEFFSIMKSYSLHELNEYIRRVLALNVPEALWVRCEIMQVNEARGHYFIELAQKANDTDNIIAQASAVIWQSTYRQLRSKLGLIINDLLQEGIEVQIKARVDFNERYGLKLLIEDIDPAYTLGKLEMQRQQTITALQQAGLIGKNAALPLSSVLQRIAILSSERAAGYQDFWQHLTQNSYRYQFACKLFPTAMQGDQLVPEMLSQLKNIERQHERFDCVVIIRGGGARLDLTAFDSLQLCQAVAQFPLPVLTGIGHDVDETVMDMVAHSALKTPTAVADFLIAHNLSFESALLTYGRRLRLSALQNTKNQALLLQNLQQRWQLRTKQSFAEARRLLDYTTAAIPRLARLQVRTANQHLEKFDKIIQLMSIEATLKRGFSITMKNRRIVKSATEIQAGDALTTHLADGEITSKAD